MSPRAYSPLAELSQHTARIFDMFRPSGITAMFRPVAEIIRPVAVDVPVIKSMGSTAEVMRVIGKESAAADETAKALATLPKRTQRELTTITVRCPGNSLLLQVMRIPAHLPGAAYDTHLVISKSGVTYLVHPGGHRHAWFLDGHDLSYLLRCRCRHKPVTLTSERLRGESPTPAGIRLLRS